MIRRLEARIASRYLPICRRSAQAPIATKRRDVAVHQALLQKSSLVTFAAPDSTNAGLKFSIENSTTGGKLQLVVPQKIDHLNLYLDPSAICPEPFVKLVLQPQEEAQWTGNTNSNPNRKLMDRVSWTGELVRLPALPVRACTFGQIFWAALSLGFSCTSSWNWIIALSNAPFGKEPRRGCRGLRQVGVDLQRLFVMRHSLIDSPYLEKSHAEVAVGFGKLGLICNAFS